MRHQNSSTSVTSDIFKKCEKCKERPGSIRCSECKKIGSYEMLCYTCNRFVHENLMHTYEYASFNDMLMTDRVDSSKQLPLIEKVDNLSLNDSQEGVENKNLSNKQNARQSENTTKGIKDPVYNYKQKRQEERKITREPLQEIGRNNKDYQTFGREFEGMESISQNELRHGTLYFFKDDDPPNRFDSNGFFKKKNANEESRSRNNSESRKPPKYISGSAKHRSKNYCSEDDNEEFCYDESLASNQRNSIANGHSIDSEKDSRSDWRENIRSTPQAPICARRKRSSQKEILSPTPCISKRLVQQSPTPMSTERTPLISQQYVETLKELHQTELRNMETKLTLELETLKTKSEKDMAEMSSQLNEALENLSSTSSKLQDYSDQISDYSKIVYNLQTQNDLLKEENSLLRATTETERERTSHSLSSHLNKLKAKHLDEIARLKSELASKMEAIISQKDDEIVSKNKKIASLEKLINY